MQIFTDLFLHCVIGLAIKSDQYLDSFPRYYHTLLKRSFLWSIISIIAIPILITAEYQPGNRKSRTLVVWVGLVWAWRVCPKLLWLRLILKIVELCGEERIIRVCLKKKKKFSSLTNFEGDEKWYTVKNKGGGRRYFQRKINSSTGKAFCSR